MARRTRPTAGSGGTKPDRHHGGLELPDELQDRPEQNAGYDEAVREGPPLESPASPDFIDTDLVDLDDEASVRRAVRRRKQQE